jgi:hypothetical protein
MKHKKLISIAIICSIVIGFCIYFYQKSQPIAPQPDLKIAILYDTKLNSFCKKENEVNSFIGGSFDTVNNMFGCKKQRFSVEFLNFGFIVNPKKQSEYFYPFQTACEYLFEEYKSNKYNDSKGYTAVKYQPNDNSCIAN